MNVLHQVNSLGIGGVETFVYRLCEFSNEDVAVYSHKDGPVRKWLDDIEVPVFFKDIEKVIEENAIDVLVMHTGSYYPDYAETLRKRFPKLKIVSVMHTIHPGDPWVDAVVAISRTVYDAQIDKDKTRLIFPGIDSSRNRSFRSEQFVIGDVTRLAPYKYIHDLFGVAELLAKDGCDFVFKIVGGEAADAAGCMQSLKDEANKRGLTRFFEFTGYLDIVPWEEFDAFVHLVGPREAYPVTLLEALERRLPTITTHGAGTEEIAQRHQELLFAKSTGDVAQLIKAMIGKRPKHIREVAKEFSKLYAELVG